MIGCKLNAVACQGSTGEQKRAEPKRPKESEPQQIEVLPQAGSSRCEHKRRKENSKKHCQCLRYWATGEKRHSKKGPPLYEA